VADTPIARSPIAPARPVEIVGGWEVSRRTSSATLRLADLSPLTKIGVKAEKPPFDIGYGRSSRLGDWLVIGSGPGEWTLLGPIGEAKEIATVGFATVTDLTHGRALVRLTGDRAPKLMEKVCSTDLSDHMCPNGAAFRSSVANVVTDVIRHDIEETRSYLLHCERSSGPFLFDVLLDAGVEFGIDVDGFPHRGPNFSWTDG
jgi:heterotetrameric sarcosine oxidase gamma subunit